MTAPDPLAVRMYDNTIANHEKTARDALNHLLRQLGSVDVSSTATALGTARNATTTLAELTAALSALKAAEDLRFLAKED